MRSRSIAVLLLAAGIWLMVLVAWRGALGADFVFDDIVRILGEERLIVAPWNSWQTMVSGQRPLVQLSLGLNHLLGGLNPWGYHAFNILVHATAAVAAFLAALCCVDRLRVRHVVSISEHAALFSAVAVAVLWAMHPLQTAAATYVIQRAEAMAGLFILTAVACLCCAAQELPRAAGIARTRGSFGVWHAATVGCCLLAIAAKPTAACGPALLLAVDAFILTGSLVATLRLRWLLHGALWATTLVLLPLGVVRGVFANGAGNAGAGLRVAGTSPLQYAATQVRAVGLYMGEVVCPSLMSIDHGAEELVAPWTLAVGVATLALLTVLVVVALARKQWWGVLPVCFVLLLAPSSSFVPLADVAADHRMYLPLVIVMAGIVSIAAAFWSFAQRRSSRIGHWMSVGMAVLLVVVVTMETIGTSLRNQDYADPLLLWNQVIARRPEHVRARINRAGLLMQRGRNDDAQADLDIAAGLRPQDPLLGLYWGILELRRGHAAEALELFDQVTPSLNRSATLHGARGEALRTLERPCEAVDAFRRAAVFAPSAAQWHALEEMCRAECADHPPAAKRTFDKFTSEASQ